MQIASKRFGIEAAPTVYQFKRWMNCNEAELHSKHSFPMHALTRKIMHSSAPSDWWADYGGSMKELQQLAELVLSVCPHACGCERTWSVSGGILTGGRSWGAWACWPVCSTTTAWPHCCPGRQQQTTGPSPWTGWTRCPRSQRACSRE